MAASSAPGLCRAPEHIGFKQTVHGGIIATVLDEIMVWACAVQTRRFAYCAELNVRFASPLRPGEEVLATAELVSNRRDRIFEARGELRDASDRVLASATGKYLPLKRPKSRKCSPILSATPAASSTRLRQAPRNFEV